MKYLGIDEKEFKVVVEEIQESNKDIIEAFRRIATNVDITMKFKEYCNKRKEIKESGVKGDVEKSEEIVKIFFNNAREFMKEYFKIELENLDNLNFKYDNGKTSINISRLYALFVQAGNDEEDNFPGMERKNREVMVKEFAAKLRERTELEIPLEKVSAYLVIKTAKNAKSNMDRLASNIQRYYSMNKEKRLEEAEISELCSFYGKILDVFLINSDDEISEDLNKEYKRIVGKYRKICQ